jgi:hypothetical protein
VGVRILAAALAAAALIPTPASAQRTKFAGLRECERFGAVQFLRQNPTFRRFIIDRSSVEEDKFAAQAGTQFVSTIYHGKALYEAGTAGPKTVRFICLHAGYRRGPVFVYTMPE